MTAPPVLAAHVRRMLAGYLRRQGEAPKATGRTFTGELVVDGSATPGHTQPHLIPVSREELDWRFVERVKQARERRERTQALRAQLAEARAAGKATRHARRLAALTRSEEDR